MKSAAPCFVLAIALSAIGCQDVDPDMVEPPAADGGVTTDEPDASPVVELVSNPCEIGCIVETLAGTGEAGFRDGPVSGARLDRPISIAVGDDGAIYIGDQRNHRIRALLPNSTELVTIAGTGDPGFADGTASEAKFWNPRGLIVAHDGSILVADSSNHRIRRIADGVVTTVAGSGPSGSVLGAHLDGPVTSARFYLPSGLDEDDLGRIWVADSENHVVRVIENGVVTTVGKTDGWGYADGPSDLARFDMPTDVAIGSHGSVYVADWGNHRIRRIDSTGAVTTFAGSGAIGIANLGGYVDGPAASAELAGPWGVEIDDQDRVYIADSRNHRIRVVLQHPDGPVVETLAGSGDAGFDTGGHHDGDADKARFNLLRGLSIASDGSIYVAGYEGHRIRRVLTP